MSAKTYHVSLSCESGDDTEPSRLPIGCCDSIDRERGRCRTSATSFCPASGIRAEVGQARQILEAANNFARGLEATILPDINVTVVDSIQENGAKLVETDADTARRINESQAPVRALPEIVYPLPDLMPAANRPTAKLVPAVNAVPFTVHCRDVHTQAPVTGATVVAFSNFTSRAGDQKVTDPNGDATLSLVGATIDRLYVYSPQGYWGAFRQNIPVANTMLDLDPVNLAYVDEVRASYGNSRFNVGAGVRVGVLDTGCGPHTDLAIAGGHCTVTGEQDADWRDYNIHGTHVAGLIGAKGGLRGVAPGVQMHAYRVFPQTGGGASNYAIMKALWFAALDQCDIVNLSLGGGPYDEIVEEAIADACNQGMLALIAAGNDGRKAVSYPAAYTDAVAVSAYGEVGRFPAGSVDDAEVVYPPTSPANHNAFIAGFSNIGPQIMVTGAGVGVLSTLPRNGYGPLSGTSMATPVVVGATASLLSQNPAVFGMPRDRARSNAIRNLLQMNCVKFGFGAIYEGFGTPDSRVV